MRYFHVAIGVFMACAGMAQNEGDALRISLAQPGGTARSNGLANAFGALGADPACIGINPAGLGLYRNSGLSFTSSLDVNSTSSRHYGTSGEDYQTRFAFSNLALVLNTKAEEGSDWRSGTFGMIYDRTQSHHWSTTANGTNVPSSIVQGFADEASGTPYTTLSSDLPFTAGLAWDAYAIDTIGGSTDQYAPFPFGSTTKQLHTIEGHGANTRTAFFYSGNYMDQLYVGMSVGLNGHRFNRVTSHTEYSEDPTTDLRQVVYREDLTTTGNGIDIKLGALARITDRVRAGAAFMSPQWMRLNDAYSMQVRTLFSTPDQDGNFDYEAVSPDGTYAYRVNTPWRATASVAYLAGKNGAVSLDYEYADMRTMRFRPSNQLDDDYDFRVENDAIKDRFRQVHTLRVGTEWRIGNWYYRGGWSFTQDPYKLNDPESGQALKTYAAGLGYRGEHISVDLSANYTTQRTSFYQYAPYLVNATTVERTGISTFLTFAFRP